MVVGFCEYFDGDSRWFWVVVKFLWIPMGRCC